MAKRRVQATGSAPGSSPQTGPGQYRLARIKELLAERARRKREALRLYEPLPSQKPFHESNAKNRVLRGSNRGGKTLPAAVEVARAVTGQDPFGKWPKTDGRFFIVGKDLDHIAKVMWWKLSKKGQFRIIRDRQTGEWRSYRPWETWDAANEDKARPAPPLIPPRFIQKIAWESRAKGIPKEVTLINGWQLSFYTSEGKPRRGADIDGAWFDEEVMDDDWYPEMVARTLDRRGKIIWSATPQTGAERLLELSERAERERDLPPAERAVEEFLVLILENPFVPPKEKIEFANSLREEERETRLEGGFAQHARKMFPEFSAKIHVCDHFLIPNDWTRYMVVDPGRQVCAVLFAAIPSTDRAFNVYLYDELYIKNCSASVFGERLASKCIGQQFEAAIIDAHGARLTDIGSGRSVMQQYSEQLKKYKLKQARTGFSFAQGYDNVDAGIEEVRALLRVRENGTPALQILAGTCKNLLDEIRRYRYKLVNGIVTDKPEDRGAVHQMANLRYLASYRPKYVPRVKGPARASPAVAALRDKERKAREKSGNSGNRVNLGPGKLKGGY